jgi:predicted nucleic acid-binding protein
MDVVFLDANVLFSAAYLIESDFLKLWKMSGVRLVSSAYAADEARRSLSGPDRRNRLEKLLESVELVDAAHEQMLPPGVNLPAKDEPILIAAIAANSTHLLTGDWRHFGPYLDKVVAGVHVMSAAAYFRSRSL